MFQQISSQKHQSKKWTKQTASNNGIRTVNLETFREKQKVAYQTHFFNSSQITNNIKYEINISNFNT